MLQGKDFRRFHVLVAALDLTCNSFAQDLCAEHEVPESHGVGHALRVLEHVNKARPSILQQSTSLIDMLPAAQAVY